MIRRVIPCEAGSVLVFGVCIDIYRNREEKTRVEANTARWKSRLEE